MPTRKGTSPGNSSPRQRSSRSLSNEDFILLALLQLGGASKFIDCEDIAYQANKLAPGRFTWVKYRDQINIHTIKTRLWVAKSQRGGCRVVGSDRQGWMLTERGLATIRALPECDNQSTEVRYRPTADDQWKQHERSRLLTTDAYRKLVGKEKLSPADVTISEAETFFRLNAYIVDEARVNKIQKLINAFGQDPELGPIVQILAMRLRAE